MSLDALGLVVRILLEALTHPFQLHCGQILGAKYAGGGESSSGGPTELPAPDPTASWHEMSLRRREAPSREDAHPTPTPTACFLFVSPAGPKASLRSAPILPDPLTVDLRALGSPGHHS